MVEQVVDPMQQIIDDVKGDSQYERCQYRLAKLIEVTEEYQKEKADLENHKANLLISTNWGDELPDIKRPTIGDKEAWIKIDCYESNKSIAILSTKKNCVKNCTNLKK